jgi:hypothetical protein
MVEVDEFDERLEGGSLLDFLCSHSLVDSPGVPFNADDEAVTIFFILVDMNKNDVVLWLVLHLL